MSQHEFDRSVSVADGDGPSSADVAAPAALRFTPAIYGLIILLGALTGLGPLAVDMYLPAFPAIAGEFGTTEAVVERTLAVYFIGIALGQLVYGPATDRFGRKKPLYVGLATFMVASAGCALARSIDSLILFRLLQALGGCAEMVVARAVVRDRFEARDAARVFSSLVLVMGLAPILAPLVGGWVLAVGGWRWIFWILGAIAGLCLICVAVFFRESCPPEKRQNQGPGDVLKTYGRLLADRDFLKYVLPGALASAGMFAYISGSPFVFMGLHGVEPHQFGYFFGANAAGLILCSQINGQLIRRGGDPELILRKALKCSAVAGLCLLAAGATGLGGFAGILIPLFVFVATLGFIYPNTTALAMAPHGKTAGNASAVLGCFQFLLGGVGVFCVSLLHNNTALPMALLVAVCGVGALLANRLLHN